MQDTPVQIDTTAERLARIETKLDGFLDTQRDQEERLRKQEGRTTALMGGGGIISALLTAWALFSTTISGGFPDG